jgi:O-methyltransferase
MNRISPIGFISRITLKCITYAVSKKNGALVFYNGPAQKPVINAINEIRQERQLLLTTNEAFQLSMLVSNTVKLDGDIAEVGCFEGGSTKIICQAKGLKNLHVFDTFGGLPGLNQVDKQEQFYEGQYSSSYEDVKAYLSKFENVNLYKGLFPGTAGPVAENKFSFVHLDLDLYESTLDSLEFFYQRMVIGGCIMSHDYSTAPGVKKAFDDFFREKKEPIIELSGTQCLIIKVA